MSDQESTSDTQSGSMFDAVNQLSRLRLLSVVVAVALFVMTGAAFVQVISGHVAVHKMGLSETEVVEYSSDVGNESVTITVENPTSKEYTVTSVLIHGFVGEDSVNQDGRQGLDNVTVPANGNTTFTVPLNVPDDRREMYHDRESLVFEGSVRIEYGSERMLIEVGPTEVDR